MWLFTSDRNGGLLMPAAVPMDLADPKFTENGKFDFQIRARLPEHLKAFTDAYMEPGTFSAIQLTPDMDYNARFYTTRELFAAAFAKAIMDIDYEKFKPTAKDERYHGVLNSIWGTLTRLAPAGGVWAAGYRAPGKHKRLGSTFGTIDAQVDDEGHMTDWEPSRAKTGNEIAAELEKARIPLRDWPEYVVDHREWSLLRPIWTRRMRAESKVTRKAEKNYKRS